MAFIEFLDTWPDVTIQRDKTELHIFTSYFNKIDQNMIIEFIAKQPETGKDKATSTKFKAESCKCFINRQYPNAIVAYTKSIGYAPYGSFAYTLAIAGRVAALFEMKKYKDCLLDISRLLQMENIGNMRFNIYLWQAKCYVELKYFAKASVAIETAKTCFKTARPRLKKTDIDYVIRKIKEIYKALENNGKVDMGTDKIEQSVVPELTNGENPLFTCASNSLAVKKTKRCGRHIVATADIKKGDVLFVEEPYSTGVFVVSDDCFVYCSQCFASSMSCIPCKSCTSVFYCTDECRQLSWDTRHRWECASVIRKLLALEQSLVLGILCQASHTAFRTAVPNARMFGSSQDNYPYLSQLMTHKHYMPANLYTAHVKMAVCLVVYLMHFTDYFDWLHAQEAMAQRSRAQLHCMIGGFLLKHLSQIASNGDTITDTWVVITNKSTVSLTSNVLAHALYVSSALLNHSCMPNAVKSFHGKTKIVRAVTDIKSGSEVTVDYLASDNLALLNPTRTKQLSERFYFSCPCRFCVAEESFFPWLCPRCQGPALPPTEDERTAKCVDCQHLFLLEAYRQLHGRYLTGSQVYLAENLNRTLSAYKQILHPTNPHFYEVYQKLTRDLHSRGEFTRALEYIDLVAAGYEAIFGDRPSLCMAQVALEHCLTLAHYSLAVEPRNHALHKQIEAQAETACDRSAELLRYHLHPQHIDCYRQKFQDILNSRSFTYTAGRLICHCDRMKLC